MSISVADASGQTIAWIVMWLSVGVALAIAIVLMRRGSVAGTWRVGSEPGALRSLALVTLLGLGAWLLIPSFVAAALQAGAMPAAATAPATAPATQTTPPIPPTPSVFTPRQGVIVSIVAGAGAALVLVGGNVTFRPGGLRQLGFALVGIGRGLFAGILASLIVLPLTFVVALLTDAFWRRVGLEHPGVHEMLEILGTAESRGLRVLIYISAILVAPVFEELLFRGHVQTLLGGLVGTSFTPPPSSSDVEMRAVEASIETAPPQSTLEYAPPTLGRPSHAGASARWAAIVATSLLFALVHGALWMMPPIFFLSVCLGYVYERTANLWAVIVVHLLFNLTNVTLFVNFVAR